LKFGGRGNLSMNTVLSIMKLIYLSSVLLEKPVVAQNSSFSHSWSWALLEKLPSVQLLMNFPAFLWNPEVHYPVHKYPPLVFILSQIDPVNATSSISLRSILILSIHLRVLLPKGLLTYGFPTNILYAFLFSPIRATCPAHLILLDLVVAQITKFPSFVEHDGSFLVHSGPLLEPLWHR
jgi:hypothetical protein